MEWPSEDAALCGVEDDGGGHDGVAEEREDVQARVSHGSRRVEDGAVGLRPEKLALWQLFRKEFYQMKSGMLTFVRARATHGCPQATSPRASATRPGRRSTPPRARSSRRRSARTERATTSLTTPPRSSVPFRSVPIVKLERGTHKYVQVQLTHPDEPGTPILVVRSVDVRRCPYHADVYRALVDELGSDARTRGVIGRVIGGGRIRRDAATVSCAIFWRFSPTLGFNV